jgi:hypothetical protein
LQHIILRHRLASDLVGDRALDDRPVDAARAGLLLDILEAAIDDRIDVVELALDALGAVVPAAPASVATLAAVATIAPAAGTLASAVALARATTRSGTAITVRARLAWRGLATGGGRPIVRPIAARTAIAATRRAIGIARCWRRALRCTFRGSRVLAGATELRRPAASPAASQRLSVRPETRALRRSLGR